MTTENKKEFTMKQVFAMWSRRSKENKSYFTGKNEEGDRLIGFFNGQKKNPKEPDVRIYKVDDKGKAEKEVYTSLWLNVSKNEKRYLSGKVGDKKVVGFINEGAGPDDKRPYFAVYESDQEPQPKEEAKKEVEQAPAPF